jgi:hypothetical protein
VRSAQSERFVGTLHQNAALSLHHSHCASPPRSLSGGWATSRSIASSAMGRRPSRPTPDHSILSWKSEQERNAVDGIVSKLRGLRPLSDRTLEMALLLDRTLIGLQISARFGDIVEPYVGTVKSLEYFASRERVYCTLWLNSMQEEKFVIADSQVDSLFTLTKKGKEDWEEAVGLKPNPPRDSTRLSFWKSDTETRQVGVLVDGLRSQRPRTQWRESPVLELLLDRTLVGLEIEIPPPAESARKPLVGTVKELFYEARSNSVRCTLWIETGMQRTFVITAASKFELTQRGMLDWQKALDYVAPLESAPINADCLLQDTDVDGLLSLLRKDIRACERNAATDSERATARANFFWPVESHVFESTVCGNANAAISLEECVKQSGDGFPRDRLLVPACVGGKTHWILLVVRLDVDPTQVQIIDSLRPWIDYDAGLRAVCVHAKVRGLVAIFLSPRLDVPCRVT